ncbi:MAG TPA: AAA family ATPase [Elusimicrobiota bacterium]|nr:AAA family ATPase [Elusimicrobiota bacterium]
MDMQRPPIDTVFTPRNSTVNRTMYVKRPDLEKDLKRALSGNLHVIVHGESGGGKSWLYKTILEDEGVFTWTINCANALRLGSISNAIGSALASEGHVDHAGYTEEKTAEVGVPLIAAGGLAHKDTYELPKKDPLEIALAQIRRKVDPKKPCMLVVENLESIFSDGTLMSELGSIITLLDDEHYSQFNVRLLIIGIPSQVKEYFQKINTAVANRLQEIREVSRLTQPQVSELIEKGFTQQLRVKVDAVALSYWKGHIYHVTTGIPQRVHEYCLELGALCEENSWEGTSEMVKTADIKWLQRSLTNSYSKVEEVMNDRATKAGRRNQVLYALGKVNSDNFRVADIERAVRTEFPTTTAGITLGVSQILSDLASRSEPIIKSTIKGDAYYFSEPRHLMCLRVMLNKNSDESISKINLSSLNS